MQKIKRILKENKIIVIIILVFILLVAYKIISSHIQEEKEKAVLHERARLEALEKKPFEDCLNRAKEEDFSARESYLNYDYTGAVTLNGNSIPGFKECMTKEKDQSICVKTRHEWYRWREELLQKSKDECYRQYK